MGDVGKAGCTPPSVGGGWVSVREHSWAGTMGASTGAQTQRWRKCGGASGRSGSQWAVRSKGYAGSGTRWVSAAE